MIFHKIVKIGSVRPVELVEPKIKPIFDPISALNHCGSELKKNICVNRHITGNSPCLSGSGFCTSFHQTSNVNLGWSSSEKVLWGV
jgi:hypothetical protein